MLGVKITQSFKIRENGNINGMCPKGKKHYLECINCEDLLSMNRPLGIPVKIVCRCGGVEGYTLGETLKEKARQRLGSG